MIPPTNEEIDFEARSRGDDRQTAIQRLTAKAEWQGDRIAKVSPDSASEIQLALDEAEAASARARELLESQRELIESLSRQLESLAVQRAEVGVIRGFSITPETQAQMAEEALQAFLDNQRSPSTQTLSNYDQRVQHLAANVALQPHIKSFADKLEAAANNRASSIIKTALEEKVDLKNLIAVMRHEAGIASEASGPRNPRLQNLIIAGHLDDFLSETAAGK